jgi:preprotein translocase subunit SecE
MPKAKKVRQPNVLVRLINETLGELRKVTWPTRDETMRLTAIVLVVLIVSALFLGAIDLLLTEIFRSLLG